MKRTTASLVIATFASCTIPSTHVYSEAQEQSLVLEEIVVTAQKREESLQEVPVTLLAFTSDMLEEAGIPTTDFLGEIVPNLQSARQIGASTPFLRGVGTANSAMGDESSIPLFVDGIYSASMYANDQQFSNVERVEVLKGPQGTLFGRNASGGLIHIITKDPSHEAGGNLGVSYGDYETTIADVYATGGISETVAADISIRYRQQGDGYGTNVTTGGSINYTDRTTVRTKWLITPTEEASITLIGTYNERKGNLGAARGPAPGALGIDGALVFQGCLGAGGDAASCGAAAVGAATKAQSNRQDVAADTESISDTQQVALSATVEYAFENFDLVSLTGYQDTEQADFLDQDATPLPVVNAPLPREEGMLSQELQLLSTTSGPLSWILGLYYLEFDASYTGFGLRGIGLPLLAAGLTKLDLHVDQDLKSQAAFAQLSYDIADRATLTAGARYTKDERDINGITSFEFGPVMANAPFSGGESWAEPTWRLALDFAASENLMLFGSYSRGFKSGVFNSVVTSGVLAPPVEPELLDAYEIGFKSDLLDNRVRLNGTVFFYDYSDLQLVAISAGIVRLSNAASSEVMGADIEFAASVSEGLDVRVGLGLLDTEYLQYDCVISSPTGIGGNAQTPTPGGCDGNSLTRAPELTGNIGLTHRIQSDVGNFRTSLNWQFNDGFYWEPDNRVKEESYDLLNVEISWTNSQESLRLRAFGNNLTDTEYSIYTNSGQFGDLASMAPPRTWGVGFNLYW